MVPLPETVHKYLVKNGAPHPVHHFQHVVFINIRHLKEIVKTFFKPIFPGYAVFAEIPGGSCLFYFKNIGKAYIGKHHPDFIIMIQPVTVFYFHWYFFPVKGEVIFLGIYQKNLCLFIFPCHSQPDDQFFFSWFLPSHFFS